LHFIIKLATQQLQSRETPLLADRTQIFLSVFNSFAQQIYSKMRIYFILFALATLCGATTFNIPSFDGAFTNPLATTCSAGVDSSTVATVQYSLWGNCNYWAPGGTFLKFNISAVSSFGDVDVAYLRLYPASQSDYIIYGATITLDVVSSAWNSSVFCPSDAGVLESLPSFWAPENSNQGGIFVNVTDAVAAAVANCDSVISLRLFVDCNSAYYFRSRTHSDLYPVLLVNHIDHASTQAVTTAVPTTAAVTTQAVTTQPSTTKAVTTRAVTTKRS
jgi:hypothetical protein